MKTQIIILLSVSLAVFVAVSGCTTHAALHDRYDSISNGMSDQEVQQILGPPVTQSLHTWRYVAPFHVVVIPFKNGLVSANVRYENHERDYFAREYMD